MTWFYYKLQQNSFIFLLIVLFTDPAFAAMKTGDKAPVFTLPAASGENITWPLNGSMILSFFATWCQPCRDELPLLDSAVEELRGKGVAVVIVGVKESFPKIESLLTALNVKKPVVLIDKDGKVAMLYQVRILPTSYFIGKDGLVKDIIFGEIRDEAELRKSVKKIE